jgi:outer membrane protein TolC
VEVGEVSPTDAIQSEVAAEAAAFDVAAAEAAARADRVPLATALGLSPSEALAVQGSLALVASPPRDVTHPDQRAIEADARTAQSDRKAADAARWPTVDGTASVGTSSIGTTVPNVNLTPQAGLGLSLDWPLLDFGVNADQRVAAANVAVLSKQRAAELLRIAGEQERASINLEAQQGLRDRAGRLVESARAALAAVEGRYQAGAARIADLLEAQAALSQAEMTLVQAKLGAAQAAVDVALAHGVVDGSVLRAQEAAAPLR